MFSKMRRSLQTWCHQLGSKPFDSADAEAAFKKHWSSHVAMWSILGHALAFAIHLLVTAWSILSQATLKDNMFQWATDDLRTVCFAVVMVILVLQFALCVGLVVAFLTRFASVNWEVVSLISVTASGVLIPWLNPWHGSVLFGYEPTQVWVVETEEYEALRMLALVSVSMTYAMYVPIRRRYVWIMPFCCGLSFCLLWNCVGSPYPGTVPFKMVVLGLLLFLPIGLQSPEQHLCERWMALRQLSKQQGELCCMQAMSDALCEVVFGLTELFDFFGEQDLRDSFFGRSVEGLRFTDFLPRADKHRFKELAARVSESGRLESIPITLAHGSRRSEFSLFLVRSRETDCEHGDAQYLVGLKALKEEDFTQANLASVLPAVSEPDSWESASNTIIPGLVPGHDPTDECSSLAMSDSTFSGFRSAWQADAGLSVVGGMARASVIESSAVPLMESVAVGTQTLQDLAAERAEVAVNTTLVWDDSGFRCSACARPPRLPGGMPPAVRPRRRRQSRQASARRPRDAYRGAALDGDWLLDPGDAAGTADWLSSLKIRGASVELGDGSEDFIKEHEGETALCGGMVFLDDDRLIRRGKSGRIFVFHRTVADDQSTTNRAYERSSSSSSSSQQGQEEQRGSERSTRQPSDAAQRYESEELDSYCDSEMSDTDSLASFYELPQAQDDLGSARSSTDID